MNFRRLLLVFIVLASALSAQVTAVLESTTQSIQPGSPFTVVLHLTHAEHWHTYWRNAGTGYPTSLSLKLPEGWTTSEIAWPAPKTIVDAHGAITGNGYDGEILLPVVLTPPANLEKGSTVTITGKSAWLMCNDRCIPGKAAVTLSLPVSPDTPAPNLPVLNALGAQSKPTPWADGMVSVHRTANSVVVRIPGLGASEQVRFFSNEDVVAYEQPQTFAVSDNVGVITAPLSASALETPPTRLDGVVTLRDANGKTRAIAVSSEFTPLPTAKAPTATLTTTLPATLALAWLGGLILNLMPCVFPVLGIKVLGFVHQSGEARSHVKWHGIVFTIGVLLSFWALAGVLAILRSSGQDVGWGFQLQSPVFVYGLAVVMLVFALSMSGVFEFGLSATGIGANLQMRSGLTGSFFTGILATVVATPCSAPFLAPALGAALAVSTSESFLIFSAIGVGLSTPYLLLSIFPSAVRALPRPGAWMETFKQIMAFPLYGTVAWLCWVLAGQLQDAALLNALIGLVVIALATWAYGRFHRLGGSWLSIAIPLAILAVGGWVGYPTAPGSDEIRWQQWSPEAVAKARSEGRTVFVDFTARWCATCQTNKKLVLHSSEVLGAFRTGQVVAFRGDWTNQDPQITQELARFHRSAVPFNQIYKPGSEAPVLLPEILTKDVVLHALQ